MNDWDRSFFEGLSLDDLLELLNAADFLDIKPLLDQGRQRVALCIKGKSADEMRAFLGINSDKGKAKDKEESTPENRKKKKKRSGRK